MNTYRFKAQLDCPNGKLRDLYDVELRSPSAILVEKIHEIMETIKAPIFQEDLADLLRNTLGCEVIVSGTHFGILVICERK